MLIDGGSLPDLSIVGLLRAIDACLLIVFAAEPAGDVADESKTLLLPFFLLREYSEYLIFRVYITNMIFSY